MMKLLSQLEHVDNATPLARRLDGNISEGIALPPVSSGDAQSACDETADLPWNGPPSGPKTQHVEQQLFHAVSR